MKNLENLIRERIKQELTETTIPSTLGELMVTKSNKANIDELQTLFNCAVNLKAKELAYADQIKCWLETTNTVRKSLSTALEQAAEKMIGEFTSNSRPIR